MTKPKWVYLPWHIVFDLLQTLAYALIFMYMYVQVCYTKLTEQQREKRKTDIRQSAICVTTTTTTSANKHHAES
jgi:hypothetical protein